MTSVELAYPLLLLLLLLLELIQDLLIDVLPQRLVLRLQLGGKLLQMLDLVLILSNSFLMLLFKAVVTKSLENNSDL